MHEPIDLVDSPERTRAALATIVATFSGAWASGAPPDLSAYLPHGPAERRSISIELIKIDLEYRWLPGIPERDMRVLQAAWNQPGEVRQPERHDDAASNEHREREAARERDRVAERERQRTLGREPGRIEVVQEFR